MCSGWLCQFFCQFQFVSVVSVGSSFSIWLPLETGAHFLRLMSASLQIQNGLTANEIIGETGRNLVRFSAPISGNIQSNVIELIRRRQSRVHAPNWLPSGWLSRRPRDRHDNRYDVIETDVIRSNWEEEFHPTRSRCCEFNPWQIRLFIPLFKNFFLFGKVRPLLEVHVMAVTWRHSRPS